jgi:hypothetical protein
MRLCARVRVLVRVLSVRGALRHGFSQPWDVVARYGIQVTALDPK